jgi:hypothetical protein
VFSKDLGFATTIPNTEGFKHFGRHAVTHFKSDDALLQRVWYCKAFSKLAISLVSTILIEVL